MISVSQAGGRVSAAWTLPPNVVAWNVWVVPNRPVFSNELHAYPLDAETATSWTSPERSLSGFHFVMVEGYDNACACVVRSNVMRVAVPNRRPRTRGGSARAIGYVHHFFAGGTTYTTEVRVVVRVCDDSAGRVTFQIRQVTDGRVRTFTRRRSTRDLELCERFRLTWTFAERLLTIQRFRIAIRAIDRHGARSGPVRFNLDE